MCTYGRHRRGLGTIVGAAFALLIFISSYSLYIFMIQSQSTYQAVLSDVSRRDQEKSEELVDLMKITTAPLNLLKINLINTGPLPIHFTYIGVFDKTASPETQNYYAVDLFASPGENFTYTSPTIAIDASRRYQIQMVTERGNLFTASYPHPTFLDAGQTIALMQTFFVKATGDLTISYPSIQRAYRTSSQTTGFTFLRVWEVDRSQNLIWRFNVTNNGNFTYILDAKTQLRFIRTGSSTQTLFYIVYNQGTYVIPVIRTYGPSPYVVTIGPGQTQTLYFAVDLEGGDPTKGVRAVSMGTIREYIGFVSVFDSTMSLGQTITFLSIVAV